jgi:hypothetical protein
VTSTLQEASMQTSTSCLNSWLSLWLWHWSSDPKKLRTSKDLHIDILDKNHPKEHQMKVGAILGAFFGFWGMEHTNLLLECLEVGVFEVDMNLKVLSSMVLLPKKTRLPSSQQPTQSLLGASILV